MLLNNASTENEYSEKNTTPSANAIAVEVWVYNQPIFLQLKESASNQHGQAVWTREIYLAPQYVVIFRRGIFAARARSAVEEKPAQVTLSLVPEHVHPITSMLRDILCKLGG